MDRKSFIDRRLMRNRRRGPELAFQHADARTHPSYGEEPMNVKRLFIVAATLALAGAAGTASASPPAGVRCAGSAFAQLFGQNAAAPGTCAR
jgi:hypothetical protein